MMMDATHFRIVTAIRNLTGVHLQEDKLYLLESRLKQLMADNGVTSFDELARILETNSNPELKSQVVDKITTHETRFFRDEGIFDAMVMQIVPEWLKRQGVVLPTACEQTLPEQPLSSSTIMPRLQLWSAACSTGQEPYSIAMILQEKHPRLAETVFITATDISKESLDRAKKGIYTKFEVGRGLPDHYLRKYFTRIGDNEFQIDEKLRNKINFKQHNLVNEPFPGRFDVVLCRNVSIYFTEEQRKILFNKLKDSLNQDGSLILGTAESVAGYIDNFIIREFGLARYYELNSSQVFMF